jgi:hypothetical protein
MAYLNIDNLYLAQEILLFKEAYALEKIHGTCTHIGWNAENKQVHYFSGGEEHTAFVELFDTVNIRAKFEELFPDKKVVIYGECYGGKQQGMSHVYGKQLKFIAFDVKVDGVWLNVPNAEDVASKFGLEFVHYDRIDVTLENLKAYMEAPSVQAIRNGMGDNKPREGVVLRPLIELKMNNGERVIAKYKPEKNMETKTKREVSPEQLKILTDAKDIAEEWVVPNRLDHVLQKFPVDVSMESMGDIVKAMIADVYREGRNEIVESQAVSKAIGKETVILFKRRLEAKLKNNF